MSNEVADACIYVLDPRPNDGSALTSDYLDAAACHVLMLIAATMYSSSHLSLTNLADADCDKSDVAVQAKSGSWSAVFVTHSHKLGVVGLPYKQDSSSVLPSSVRQDMSYAAFGTATAQSCTTAVTRDITTSSAS